jgi:hypothetical protein
MYQCQDCVNLEKGVQKSKKELAKAAAILAQNDSDVAKQKTFLSLIKKRYSVKTIARDGDCLFNCIMVDQERLTKTKMNVQQVRDSVAAALISEMTSNGCITRQVYDFFGKNDEGVFVLNSFFESYRGAAADAAKAAEKSAKKKGVPVELPPPTPPPTLEEYADMIRGNMFGGDLETLLLANLYDLTINVFSWQFFDGDRSFSPQVYGSGSRVMR